MNFIPARIGIAIVFAAVLFVAAISAHAQHPDSIRVIPTIEERPDLWVQLQDGSHLFLVNEAGDTTHPDMVSSAYMFTMSNHPFCETTFIITEWRRNRQLLRLPDWVDERTVQARAPALSRATTTDTFTCHAGDTLSFYRELMWVDPLTFGQDSNNYFAPAALDFVVELIRDPDSTRVALLDSIGFLASPRQGPPVAHGTAPIIAMVRYVAPPELEGQRVFMRVRLFQRGTRPKQLSRTDLPTLGWSARLHDEGFESYRNALGLEPPPSYTPDDFEAALTGEPEFTVVPAKRPWNAVRVTFEAADSGATSIGIYDATGRPMFYPFMTPGDVGRRQVRYTFPGPGRYFVGLLYGRHLVAAREVSVTP